MDSTRDSTGWAINSRTEAEQGLELDANGPDPIAKYSIFHTNISLSKMKFVTGPWSPHPNSSYSIPSHHQTLKTSIVLFIRIVKIWKCLLETNFRAMYRNLGREIKLVCCISDEHNFLWPNHLQAFQSHVTWNLSILIIPKFGFTT